MIYHICDIIVEASARKGRISCDRYDYPFIKINLRLVMIIQSVVLCHLNPLVL